MLTALNRYKEVQQ